MRTFKILALVTYEVEAETHLDAQMGVVGMANGCTSDESVIGGTHEIVGTKIKCKGVSFQAHTDTTSK